METFYIGILGRHSRVAVCGRLGSVAIIDYIAMGVDSRLSRHTRPDRQGGLAITISSMVTLHTCPSITYAVTGYREGHTRLLFYI